MREKSFGKKGLALVLSVSLLMPQGVAYGKTAAWEETQAADEMKLYAAGDVVVSGKCGAALTWKLTQKTDGYELSVSGTGEMESAPWEEYKKDIVSVIIGDGVTSIKQYAFLGSRLTSIYIPASVTYIASGAIKDCSGLKSITVDEQNPVYDSRGGCNAIIEKESACLIQGCEVTKIPAGVKSIGDDAFSGCSGLTSINIPESVERIGYGAFFRCSGLESIVIPDGVTSIMNGTFCYCSGLKSVTLPASVTEIGSEVFLGCSSLTGIEIPEGVKKIGGSAFSGCSGLKSITVDEQNPVYDSRNGCNAIIEKDSGILVLGCAATRIPAGVTSIGDSAFYGCGELKSINIPEGVTSIRADAFSGCSELKSITIPASVASIGYYAFSGCSGLTDIYYGGTKGQWDALMTHAEEAKIPAAAVIHYSGTQQEESKPDKESKPVKKAVQSFGSYTKNYQKVYGSKSFSLNMKQKTGDGKLTYVSSDRKVATVDDNGKVTIAGCGICTITVTAAATSEYEKQTAAITINVSPKKAAKPSLKVAGGKKLKVSWKKDAQAGGYDVQYSTKKNFKGAKTQTVKKNSTTLKKLTKGKKYYVRIRAYKKSGKTKLCGAWSTAVLSKKVK